MKPAAIFLCEKSGQTARPWAEAGIECWCVDLQHRPRKPRTEGLIHYVYGDARSWCYPDGVRPVVVAAMPPCTHTAGSDARDFKIKGPRLLTDALDLFNACEQAARWAGCPYWVENPVGVLSTHIRKPDHIFHPWEYAGYLTDTQTDNTQKKTCLWIGGGFVMPEKRPAPSPHRQDCWNASPDEERGDLRSITYAGFARAAFLANCPKELLVRSA